MITVKELIENLEKHPSEMQVFVEFNGSVNLNEIEVVSKKLPEGIVSRENNNDIIVLRPKLN